jgi:hypothetical protein
MDEIQENLEPQGASRRTIMKGAAWAAPVVAVAVGAPLAAASPGQARIFAQAGGNISANNTAGTANGSLGGGLVLNNVVGGPWQTGLLTVEYEGTGPWSTFQITKPGGAAFVQGETIVAGGLTWTVTLVTSDVDGTWAVRMTAPSQSVSIGRTFEAPQAEFSGTFTPGAATTRNPVAGTVRVSAANVNGGSTVSSGQSFP